MFTVEQIQGVADDIGQGPSTSMTRRPGLILVYHGPLLCKHYARNSTYDSWARGFILVRDVGRVP